MEEADKGSWYPIDVGPTSSIVADQLLTMEEVCKRLGGVKPWTIRDWVSQKRIPYTKVGRLTRYPADLIDAWIKARTVLPLEEAAE